jgi:hypothetical protein
MTLVFNVFKNTVISESGLLESYVLTSTAMQNIQNIINSQKGSNTNKAWSLIGSYSNSSIIVRLLSSVIFDTAK